MSAIFSRRARMSAFGVRAEIMQTCGHVAASAGRARRAIRCSGANDRGSLRRVWGRLGFRKNESALQHSLRVKSEASSGPVRLDSPGFDRLGDILLDLVRMIADRSGAGSRMAGWVS